MCLRLINFITAININFYIFLTDESNIAAMCHRNILFKSHVCKNKFGIIFIISVIYWTGYTKKLRIFNNFLNLLNLTISILLRTENSNILKISKTSYIFINFRKLFRISYIYVRKKYFIFLNANALLM